jgi:alginate O-acetyltransferase complex protein AlgI
VFSSLVFLYYFLPVTLLIYFAVPRSLKNGVLLTASLFFYFYGEPVYTILLLFSSVSDYFHSRYIERHRGGARAKIALFSAVVINLGMLGFFKYADFFIHNWNLISGAKVPLMYLSLPIGISFFTFQTMSYTIDVYRGEVAAEKGLLPMTTYVSLFPQLVAGPIVRYKAVADALRNRVHSVEDISSGMSRFVMGLGKKVLIANQLGELCRLFRMTDAPSVQYYWLYAVAFSLQIYFDFSGYSDMAIGLGRIFGFTFPENFNYPFVAESITDFWRRWHMTLGSWFRDYVYIPMGGNRVGKLKWVRNMAVVWLLTGLWHGASWNFALWGGYFGALLIFEKTIGIKWLGHLPKVLRHGYVLMMVLLSFMIFNADGFHGIRADFGGLFGGNSLPLLTMESVYQLKSYGLLLIVAMVGATPVPKCVYRRISKKLTWNPVAAFFEPLALTSVMVVVTGFLVDGSFNPFLYFRF